MQLILESAIATDHCRCRPVLPRMLSLIHAGCLIFLLGVIASPKLQVRASEIPAAISLFQEWWDEYSASDEATRTVLEKKGSSLAVKRKEVVMALIKNDPQSAIQLAFPEEYRDSLPKSIVPLVEEHVRSLASLEVTHKGSTVRRTVTVEGLKWQAYMYGPRLNLESREEIPIHGVTLGGIMAVDGSPLERFPARETLIEALRQGDGRKTCPVCGKPGVIPAAVGDILLWFDTDEHLVITEKALAEKEARPEVSE